MKIYNIIKIKYLPATNTRGSRVLLTNERLLERKTIPYNHSYNNAQDIAIAYLKTKKIKVIGQDIGYIVVAPTSKHTFLSIK